MADEISSETVTEEVVPVDEGVSSPDTITEGDKGEEPKDKEPVVFDERQQEVFDTAIRKKTAQFREQERKTAALAQQMQALEAKVPKQARPDIPDMPDSFDDGYEVALATRDKAIEDRATFDATERVTSEQNLLRERDAQQNQAKVINEAVAGYLSRGERLNIAPDKLRAAGQRLIDSGLNVHLQAHLVDQAKGPQITMYLDKNPTEFDSILRMSPMDAAVAIATDIAPKAAKLLKATKHPADPSENLSGKGSKDGGRGPKGATFT